MSRLKRRSRNRSVIKANPMVCARASAPTMYLALGCRAMSAWATFSATFWGGMPRLPVVSASFWALSADLHDLDR